MGAPSLDFKKLISRLPGHVEDLPTESARPIEHYRLDANGYWNLLRYFERRTDGGYAGPRDRHTVRLRAMVVLGLIETFERFLKEIAAVCVDHLVPYVLDDRFSTFSANPRAVLAHFSTNTLGKALCEADTWLNSHDINVRFGKLLAAPFQDPAFKLLPEARAKNDPEQWRRACIDVLWQLRHSIAHNAGVLTRSDAAKLRLLTRSPVEGHKALQFTNGDVWYVKQFLDDLVGWINQRVASRLCDVLTAIHADDPSLFEPASLVQALAELFVAPLALGGIASGPPSS